MASPQIIVVGSGVQGLSCAHVLAEAGHRVEIWTREPAARSTSSVAAACWYPYQVEPLERVIPWAGESYRRFADLADETPESGVIMRETIELCPERSADPPWASEVDFFRWAGPDELAPGYEHGFVFVAPVIEMPVYLAWLVEELRGRGVEILERDLESLAPALERAPVVVNTTGLGARELVDDPRVYAVRGQTVRCELAGVDRVMLAARGDSLTYVVPRSRDCVLGGVVQERVESLREVPEHSAGILERCRALEPRLNAAAVLGVQVGLRPCRDEIRVELEPAAGGGRIIHNYGHGGAGVTLSWGCAVEVARLARS